MLKVVYFRKYILLGLLLLICGGCAKTLSVQSLATSQPIPHGLTYGVILNNFNADDPALVSLINFELDANLHKYGWKQVNYNPQDLENLPAAIVALSLTTDPPRSEYTGFYEPRYYSAFSRWRPSYDAYGVREVATYYAHHLNLEIYLTKNLLSPSLGGIIFGNNQDKALSAVRVTAETQNPQARKILPQLVRAATLMIGTTGPAKIKVGSELETEVIR